MKKKYAWFTGLFLFALIFDQGTKMWARATLKPGHRIVTVIEGLWDFRYSENQGSAFGLFHSVPAMRWVLLAIGLVAIGIIYTFLRRVRADRPRLAAEIGLLAGGAFGNIFDRIFHDGRVSDFIVWKLRGHEWPTFNVADAALVVGIIALFFDAKSDDLAKRDASPAPDKGSADKSAEGKKRRR